MKQRVKSGVAKIAAIGAVIRRGSGSIQGYGGVVKGEGEITHNSGPRKGKTTKFTIEGRPVDQQ